MLYGNFGGLGLQPHQRFSTEETPNPARAFAAIGGLSAVIQGRRFPGDGTAFPGRRPWGINQTESTGSPRSSWGMTAFSVRAARIQSCTGGSWRTVST